MSARKSWHSLHIGWLLGLLCLCQEAGAQTIYYVHTDALGSVVAESDSAGQVVSRREYEPYGQQLTPAVQDGPGYTGHVQDAATGLTYMQQRYYDPMLGRFLSTDPVQANEGGHNSLSRYGYSLNNPYSFLDPDGRESKFLEFVKGVAVGAIDSALEGAHYSSINPNIHEAYPGELSVAGQCGCDYSSPFSTPRSPEEQLGRDVSPAAGIILGLVTKSPAGSVRAIEGGGAKLANISAGEARRIQNAANRSGAEIALVGSRAGGTATARSDWDYVVNANSKTRNNISRSLPGAGNLKEGVRSEVDMFRGAVREDKPFIRFIPEDR